MTIKEINTQIHISTKKLKVLELQLNDIKHNKKKLEIELSNLHNELNSVTSEPVVTEHAILRYIEINFKIDIDEIKNRILSEDVLISLKKMGLKNGKLKNGDFTMIIKDNQIVTLIKE